MAPDLKELKSVNLLAVMHQLGFEPSKKYGGTVEYNIDENCQLAVTAHPTNSRSGNLGMFQFWKGVGCNGRTGGAGAVDLVMATTNRSFSAALGWLAGTFFAGFEGGAASVVVPTSLKAPNSPLSARRFSLPSRHKEANGVVRKYLCSARGLSPGLIVPLMDEEIIFPHLHRYDAGVQIRTFTNAVFVMRDDKTREPSGCMIRGCYDGLNPRKSTLPFKNGDGAAFWIGASLGEATRIVLTESPIECLSWAENHGLDPQTQCRTYGGNRWRSMTTIFSQVKATGAEIICAFNSDEEGRKASRELLAICAAEGLHNSELFPTGVKDWNALIIGRRV